MCDIKWAKGSFGCHAGASSKGILQLSGADVYNRRPFSLVIFTIAYYRFVGKPQMRLPDKGSGGLTVLISLDSPKALWQL
jgi:hypothetical protein